MKRLLCLGLLFITVLVFITGCSEEKFPLDVVSELAKQKYTIGDTTYLEISPPISGFVAPSTLYIGKDNLLYVLDSTRIVMMNFAGVVLADRPFENPTAIAQDYKLDLIVAGTVERTVGGSLLSVPALFRIRLLDSSRSVFHNLARAHIDTIRIESSRPNRRYVGIGVMPDNSYIVARTGPDNSSPIDPDTRVIRFSKNDQFLTPIADLATGSGNGIQFINQLTTLTMFSNSRNFLLGQKDIGVAYGVLWLVYQKTDEYEGWQPRFDPSKLSDISVDFIVQNRFVNPTGIAIDNRRLDIFIADAGQDSVFKFNSRGQLKKESFGPHQVGHKFHPYGAAYYDRTLYISDKNQKCIFRFRMSTDF